MIDRDFLSPILSAIMSLTMYLNFSDLEQYRLAPSGSSRPHHYIPYPDDPPHTFPAMKARQFRQSVRLLALPRPVSLMVPLRLFTRHPRRLAEVYIPSADPLHREALRPGARIKVLE